MIGFNNEFLYRQFQLITGSVPNSKQYDAIVTEDVKGVAIEMGYGFIAFMYGQLATQTGSTYLLRTPSDKLMTERIFSVACLDLSNVKSGMLQVEFYEGATVSNVGGNTGITVTNYNRNITDEPMAFTMTSTPTVSNNGTLIAKYYVSSNSNINVGETYQLKPSTDYLFKIYNPSTIKIDYSISSTLFQLPL